MMSVIIIQEGLARRAPIDARHEQLYQSNDTSGYHVLSSQSDYTGPLSINRTTFEPPQGMQFYPRSSSLASSLSSV